MTTSWISINERYPTKEDANVYGQVLVSNGRVVYSCHWSHYIHSKIWVKWMSIPV